MSTDNNNLTPVYLSSTDAERFKLFCKHEKTFNALLNGGVFDIHNGQALINFNSKGSLMSIRIQSVTYSSNPNEQMGKTILTEF